MNRFVSDSNTDSITTPTSKKKQTHEDLKKKLAEMLVHNIAEYDEHPEEYEQKEFTKSLSASPLEINKEQGLTKPKTNPSPFKKSLNRTEVFSNKKEALDYIASQLGLDYHPIAGFEGRIWESSTARARLSDIRGASSGKVTGRRYGNYEVSITTKSLPTSNKNHPTFLTKDHSAGTCKPGQRSDLTGCVPADGTASVPSTSDAAEPPVKRRAEKGKLVSAKRVGKGKEAQVLLASGQPAPAHITPAMIPPAWENVKISMDPDADILASGKMVNRKTGKEMHTTCYNPKFQATNQSAKFAKVIEGLSKQKEMYEENMKNRSGEDKENADVTWLMMEQATRPGSEADTKGYEALYDQPMSGDNIVVTEKKGKTSVVLVFGEKKIPIRDEGTKQELIRRQKNKEELFDAEYWLKSFGATTLEARHVIDAEDGVHLSFVGKEGVFHNHLIKNQDLGLMLLERKENKKPKEQLFNTDYGHVAKYVGKLDSGGFSPKDLRTTKACQIAIDEIKKKGACCKDADEYKASVQEVAEKVSHVLGNRWQQALESYISPTVWSVWKGAE